MQSLLATAIGWTALTLGSVTVAVGLFIAWSQRNVQPPAAQQGVGEHGGVQDVVKNAAELAKAMKDLDRAGQLLIVGVLFFAIAAFVAGVDGVVDAIAEANS